MKLRQAQGAGVAIAATLLMTCGCAQSPNSSLTPLAATSSPRRPVAQAQSRESVLYDFSGQGDGGDPAADLITDASGRLYGTTVTGGTYGCGSVFSLTPAKSPPWSESGLYDFDCYGTGKNPYGGVAFDASGNLDGTTVNGGACSTYGCGVVFQLNAGDSETVLHDFAGGADGSGPGAGVAIDASGNLYGTTPDGGADGYGVIYRVARKHGEWNETVIHTFTGGADGGVGSLGRLLIGASGDVYGVAEEGGSKGNGIVFKLSPRKGAWSFVPLYAFAGEPDGASPYGGLVADPSGDLFGTTYYGGGIGEGTVFELVRHNGMYRERVLYSFTGAADGGNPTCTLVFGSSGELYGTTSNGGTASGSNGYGVVFALDPHRRKERVLHRFGGGKNDGQHPYYGLLLAKNGALYGTTAAGGTAGHGVIFEIR